MREWSGWETVRHQVAVAGQAVDIEGRAVAGAVVTLKRVAKTSRRGPKSSGSERQVNGELYNRTRTRSDGVFFLLDVPVGEHELECVCVRRGLQGKKLVSVIWRQDGTVERVVVDLKLEPVEGVKLFGSET